MESLSWSQQAACKGLTTNMFFSEDVNQIAKAKQVCAGCPVAEECAEYAISTQQPCGVWGGLTEEERVSRSRRVRAGGDEPHDITYTTNARSTGAQCSAGRSGNGWAVVCRSHGGIAMAPSRTVAEYAVSRPEEWCEGCRKIAAGLMPKLIPLRTTLTNTGGPT